MDSNNSKILSFKIHWLTNVILHNSKCTRPYWHLSIAHAWTGITKVKNLFLEFLLESMNSSLVLLYIPNQNNNSCHTAMKFWCRYRTNTVHDCNSLHVSAWAKTLELWKICFRHIRIWRYYKCLLLYTSAGWAFFATRH